MDFLIESKEKPEPTCSPWRVLFVDDELDIHHVSNLVVDGFTHLGRSIEPVNAFSCEHAKEILSATPDFALALIDVVMETRSAGLDLIDYIRHDLNDQRMRIIVRTGQPGDAPESEVALMHEISEYRDKSQLGAIQLRTLIRTNLSTYEALRQTEEAGSHSNRTTE